MSRSTRVIQGLILALIGSTAIYRATRPFPASKLEKHKTTLLPNVGAMIAREESTWVHNAVDNFPGDLWSQRDDFHNQEQQFARELADRFHISLSYVFLSIDKSVRERGPSDLAKAVPCKPRPFYD